MQMPGTRGIEAESCTEVVDELTDAEAVEHSEPLSNRWGYRGLNAVDDLSRDEDRTFEERAGISSDISNISCLTVVSA